MEKNLNTQDERLLQLVETKAFDALNEEEKAFVQERISPEEYTRMRTVIGESKYIYPMAEPKPLQVAEKKRGFVIPLYQAVAGIAAAVIISFFIFRNESVVTKVVEKPVYAQADTVYVDRVTVDTVVEYQTRYIESTRIEERTTPGCNTAQFVSGDNDVETPDLSGFSLKHSGQPASNDPTIALIPVIGL